MLRLVILPLGNAALLETAGAAPGQHGGSTDQPIAGYRQKSSYMVNQRNQRVKVSMDNVRYPDIAYSVTLRRQRSHVRIVSGAPEAPSGPSISGRFPIFGHMLEGQPPVPAMRLLRAINGATNKDQSCNCFSIGTNHCLCDHFPKERLGRRGSASSRRCSHVQQPRHLDPRRAEAPFR